GLRPGRHQERDRRGRARRQPDRPGQPREPRSNRERNDPAHAGKASHPQGDADMAMTNDEALAPIEIVAELPAEGIRAHVRPGHALAHAPSWHVRAVNAGPLRSSAGYDAHLAATFGSTYDFGDEMRFSRADGRLSSVVLAVPERAVESTEACLATWQA